MGINSHLVLRRKFLEKIMKEKEKLPQNDAQDKVAFRF